MYIKSITPIFLLLIFYYLLILFLKKNKFVRVFNIILKKEIVALFAIVYFLSNLYINVLESSYNKFYERVDEFIQYATVVSDKKDTTFKYVYMIKLKTGEKLYLNVDKKTELDYGDYIKISGKYLKPAIQRNYGGFDYSNYLKSKQIYGTVKSDEKNIEIIKKDTIGGIRKVSNVLRSFVKFKIKNSLDEECSDLLIGILVGDTSNISMEDKEAFRQGSMAHILAVSRNACELYNDIYIFLFR